ncbi:LuxR family transcriptional regulator [Nocardioides nanhaiensis]|uniref:LuxR family transcriptional regulator n=1 Tax=Nocardioides nanhaiensis TaxID=1476871 RepID=UPI0031EFA265
MEGVGVAEHGPEQRDLFQTQAAGLYETIVGTSGISEDDPRLRPEHELRPAFDLLVELGLLQLDKTTATWVPEDPSNVASRVVSPLSQRATTLLEESSEWARAFAGLQQSWRRSPMAQSRGPFTYLHEGAIGPFLTALVAEAEEEMLTAQPQAGRDPQTLAAAALRDTAMLERGCSMRTLYQHSARRSSVTHKYVAAVTSRGAQVRTLDEFFNRMIVVDRRVAVIPGDSLSVALAVREPSVVAYLVDVFERAWERARPFTNKESSMMREIAVEQRAMTIRMLIEGHADPVSAKRLGVSPRTYAGYIADLKTEFEAATRFQLGYRMGQQGLSGHEDVEPDDHGG